jgi:hypothetical protein
VLEGVARRWVRDVKAFLDVRYIIEAIAHCSIVC